MHTPEPNGPVPPAYAGGLERDDVEKKRTESSFRYRGTPTIDQHSTLTERFHFLMNITTSVAALR